MPNEDTLSTGADVLIFFLFPDPWLLLTIIPFILSNHLIIYDIYVKCISSIRRALCLMCFSLLFFLSFKSNNFFFVITFLLSNNILFQCGAHFLFGGSLFSRSI
jgi:hypothetical protein